MKKIIGILACSSLLLSSMPVFAEAPVSDFVVTAEKAVEKKDNVPTSERLEDVIKIVKPLLDVPEKYENFTWRFNDGSYYSRPSWFFSWSDDETGEISVRCDNEGRISSYTSSVYTDEEPATVPDCSPSELEPVARAFIKKLLPHTADSELVLTSTALATVYKSTYDYEFTRYENGIPVPENTISVTVNYRTKTAERLSSSYNADITFNGTAPAISSEQAKKILGENQSMKLSYRLKTEYDDETGKIKSRKAYLVYTPETDYISVDAYTGEVYTERNTWKVNDRYSGGAGGNINGSLFDATTEDAESFEKSEGGSYTLTEKEQEQLEVLDSLITKDTAIAVIANDESLYLNESATAVSASLSLRYDNGVPLVVKNEDGSETIKERYVWNITFSSPDMGEDNSFYYRTYATVDANDGSLISFSASIPDHWYYTENELSVPEIKYTTEDAEKIASEFLKKLQHEKFENLRLYSSHDSSPVDYSLDGDGNSVPVYGNKNFIFTRVNEGVDFEYNVFNVSVSLIDGKITSYNFNWYDDVEFESPKNVISLEKALECFYSYDGFGLNYEINSNYTYNKYLTEKNDGKYIDYDELYKTENYSRPVYSAYNPGTTIIRATDGVMITGSGNEYKKESGFSYEAVENHWIKETAERLGYLEIGFEDGSFSPDENITGENLNALLRKARIYGYGSDITLSEESVTRTDAVKYILSALGLKKVALLKNTFITDFADGTAFNEEDLGFIAIARGFGIIEGDGVYFRPYDALTQAEALSIIEKVINAGLIG